MTTNRSPTEEPQNADNNETSNSASAENPFEYSGGGLRDVFIDGMFENLSPADIVNLSETCKEAKTWTEHRRNIGEVSQLLSKMMGDDIEGVERLLRLNPSLLLNADAAEILLELHPNLLLYPDGRTVNGSVRLFQGLKPYQVAKGIGCSYKMGAMMMRHILELENGNDEFKTQHNALYPDQDAGFLASGVAIYTYGPPRGIWPLKNPLFPHGDLAWQIRNAKFNNIEDNHTPHVLREQSTHQTMSQIMLQLMLDIIKYLSACILSIAPTFLTCCLAAFAAISLCESLPLLFAAEISIYAGILGTTFLYGVSNLFNKVTSNIADKFLRQYKTSDQQNDFIDSRAKKAFTDGVNAQSSWTDQLASIFNTNDYVNYTAFYAGKKVAENEDIEMLEAIAPELNTRTFRT